MKFGKVLQSTADCFPEKPFVSYKRLKKILKHRTPANRWEEDETKPRAEKECPEATIGGVVADKHEFIRLLNQELHQLNNYFISFEEDVVIRFEALSSALHDSADLDTRLKLFGSLVRFHGDVVSLLHWERINFAAITKILKKHDKLAAGQPIRKSYLEFVSQQAFYSTGTVEKMAQHSRKLIEALNPAARMDTDELETLTEDAAEADIDDKDIARLKTMLHAIRTWRDLGDNAHTPSTVVPYSKPIPESMKALRCGAEHAAVRRKRSCPSEENAEHTCICGKIARASE